MAVLRTTAFDYCSTKAQLQRSEMIDATSYTVVASSDPVLPSNNSLDLAGANTSINFYIPLSTTVIFGHLRMFDLLPFSVNGIFLSFNEGESPHVEFRLNQDGSVSARDGTGTEVGRSVYPQTFIHGVYYFIEAKVLVHASTGTIDLEVNGESWISLTGQDTQAGSVASCGLVRSINDAQSGYRCAFAYILDGTGLTNNDLLGPCYIETLYPDGDGNRNNFTRVGGGLNNYEAVDDGNNPDDDTTYVWSSVVGDDELYTFDNLTLTMDTIYCANVKPMFRTTDAGVRMARTLSRSNVTEVEGTSQSASISWMMPTDGKGVYEVDPNGGAAWDEAAINAAEFGFTIES